MMMVSSPTLLPFTASPQLPLPQVQQPMAYAPPQGVNTGTPFQFGMPYIGEVDRMLSQVNAFTSSLQGWADAIFVEDQQREAAKMQALINGVNNPSGVATQKSMASINEDAMVQAMLRNLYDAQSGKYQESVKAVKQGSPSTSTSSTSATPTTTTSTASVGKADSQRNIVPATTNADGSTKLVSIGHGHQLHAGAAAPFLAANKAFKAQYGYDLPVISSYRSPEHNKKIGGSPTSNHMKGGSLDLDSNTLNQKGHYMAAVKALRTEGFEPLDGVTYVKHGKAQDEHNHFDYVGKGNTSSDWNGPKLA